MLSILLAAAALSPPVALDQRPAWSPDGTRIAFIRVTGRRSYLEVIRADGRGPRRLSPKVADLTPAWSPDSRSIAFSRVQHRGRDATVWSIHADGNHLRKLGSGFWPAWSPDGRTIAYGHLGRIESVRSDGSHRRVLLAEGSMPAWSPDGSRLAFSVGGEPTRVFVFDRKALEVRRVAYGFWPTWSSDGSQIGYTRGLFAGVVSVNGVSDEPVLGVSGFSEPPQWSPVDGTYVYCFKHGFRESIFRGPPSTFGPLVGAGCDPSWSPDGRLIVFDRPSVDGGSSRIYLMNADGTNVRPLIR